MDQVVDLSRITGCSKGELVYGIQGVGPSFDKEFYNLQCSSRIVEQRGPNLSSNTITPNARSSPSIKRNNDRNITPPNKSVENVFKAGLEE